MVREKIDHPMNVTTKASGHWFSRLIVKVDGREQLFVGTSDNKLQARVNVESYLDPRRNCKKGTHPWCDIHQTDAN